jgi:hypothetical protein
MIPMVAIIDGDYMQYIIGNNFKDISEVSKEAVDQIEDMVFSFLQLICTTVGADKYVLAVSDPTRIYFRNALYRYKPYKGGRKDEDWFVLWRPYILGAMGKHGAQSIAYIEADDILCYLAERYNKIGEEYVICSPDKDLRQIPGAHFDYSKKPAGEGFKPENPIIVVTGHEATRFFYQQLIMGDSSDNIAGIPKMGEVKAKKFLDAVEDSMFYHRDILQLYCETFGPFYGPIIFEETWQTIKLLDTLHPKFPDFQQSLRLVNAQVWRGRMSETVFGE